MKNRKRHGGTRSNRGSFKKWDQWSFGERPKYPQSFPEWVKIGQNLCEINRVKSKFDIRESTWRIIKIEKEYDGWLVATIKSIEYEKSQENCKDKWEMVSRVKIHKIHLKFAPIYE